MRLRKLDEFMVKRGGSVDPSKFKNETFELLSIPAFDQGVPEILEGEKIGSSKKIVEPRDVLLSKIVPHIRRCWVVPERSNKRQIASGEWIQFRGDDFLPEYLRLFLVSNRFHSQFMKTVKGVGGSLLRASPAQVAEIEIPLPPLDDQKRIAHLLGKVEGLIARRKRHLQQLDDLLKSVFLEMFGFLDQAYKKWIINKLAIHTEVVSGVTKGKKYKTEELVEVPYMRVANVQDGHFALDEIKTISVTQKEINQYQLQAGDLLLTEGGDPDKLGRGSVWENQVEKCIHQNHIFRVRVNERSELNPYYLSALIGSRYGKSYFLKSAKQTTGIASINSTQLKNFPLIIPPIDLQNHFATIVDKVEGLKSRYQHSLTDLETLYGALSQKAFKGELHLSRVVLPVETSTDATEITTVVPPKKSQQHQHTKAEATP